MAGKCPGVSCIAALALCAAWSIPRAGGGVVINELMYHPPTHQGLEEFIELHNTGTEAVNLSGWCLSGVTFCFPAGSEIAAGGFVVLARDSAAFLAAYGVAPAFVYSGSLDNGGETIVLRNASQATIDTLSFTDGPGGWPVTPDGEGPSLERIDVTLGGDTPRNWHAATDAAGHTLGAANSVAASGLPPWISEVSFPRLPAPGLTFPVTARVLDATTVEMTYRFNFQEGITVPMYDDGLHGDGAAVDGVFGAFFPGTLFAGVMLRFRIAASGPSGVMSYPRDDDTIFYDGTATADPDEPTDLPLLRWYITDEDFVEANIHFETDETEPAALVVNGVLWDNIRIRVRGQYSRGWPKRSWKFTFPQGHRFFVPALLPVAVSELDLQASYADKSYLRELLSHELFGLTGAPHSLNRHVRLQRDNTFFGLYLLREAMDEEWLERNGVDPEGAWYKAYDDMRLRPEGELPSYYEKETRRWEDHSDLHELMEAIYGSSGQEQLDQLLDRLNIPDVINYLAARCIIHDNDAVAKNYFLYRDTNGTLRWTLHTYDMDLSFGRITNFGGILNDDIYADVDVVPDRPNVSPSHPLFGDSTHQKWFNEWNRLIDVIYSHPRLRKMYFRRLRTLSDELLAPGRIEARIAELLPQIATPALLDAQQFGQYGQPQTAVQAADLITNVYLPRRREHLLTTHNLPGEVPGPAPATATVLINEIMYNPLAGGAGEFVELYNPSTTDAVDVSGWRLDGVDLTLPPGAVIPAGDYMIVVRDDIAFRAAYGSGIFVAAQYNGVLDGGGDYLVLRDPSGAAVDEVRYDDDAPWPTAPDGTGPSLERIDPLRSANRPANWAASASGGGTPGGVNSATGASPLIPDLWVNEVLPSNASINTDEAGDYDPWIEIYNASDVAIDLGGMYLTDDYAIPTRWTIPPDTLLCARQWMLFWADNEPGEGPRHANFRLNPLGGSVGLYTADSVVIDYLNYDPLPVDTSYGKTPDGGPVRRVLGAPSPGASNGGGAARVIVNEYNAVSDSNFLKNNGTDTYWGRIAGNGGDWFELVVTGDRVDMRGWQLEISDDTGGAGQTVQTLTFTSDAIWSDLRSGTIITVSENLADDVSYEPSAGDWWINVRAANAASGTYVSAANFRVSNDNWQLRIRDAGGTVVFGSAGEGIQPTSGIGNDEVFRLEENPTADIIPRSDYSDGFLSSFGAPNYISAQGALQDFFQLRGGVAPCTSDADCDDRNDCTIDTCGIAGECVHTPRSPCYELRLVAPPSTCTGATLTVAVQAAALQRPVRSARMLLHYDAATLLLIDAQPGDGAGSPWNVAQESAFDDDSGDVVYALDLTGPGAMQDAVVARLTFQVVSLTAPTQVTFRSGCLPFPTSLLAGQDAMILPTLFNSGDIAPDGDTTPPIIICPANQTVRPAPGQCSATVTWTPPTATDNCGAVTLTSTHEPGASFPLGTTTVTYTATDSANNTATCSFDITVLSTVQLVVDLELARVAPATQTRCITFEVFACPQAIPIVAVEQVVVFTGGFAGGRVLELPCEYTYTCLAVRDSVHTLRRVIAPLPVVNGQYVASFTGERALIGGNLNDDDAIDMLDFAELVALAGANVGAGTNCATPPPHGDIDGDGVVFAADFSFIAAAYGQTADSVCCQFGLQPGGRPIDSVSVEELRARGLQHLVVADLNRDGWIDRQDVKCWGAGAAARRSR